MRQDLTSSIPSLEFAGLVEEHFAGVDQKKVRNYYKQ
jgi:hypothetical protein